MSLIDLYGVVSQEVVNDEIDPRSIPETKTEIGHGPPKNWAKMANARARCVIIPVRLEAKHLPGSSQTASIRKVLYALDVIMKPSETHAAIVSNYFLFFPWQNL